MFQTGTFKLGVDVQQILDSADVKVLLLLCVCVCACVRACVRACVCIYIWVE